MNDDSDVTARLKSLPFRDDLPYAQIQGILSRFLDAATDWQQNLETKRAPSSDQLREFMDVTRETGQALNLQESSESHVALRVQLARLASVDAEMESAEKATAASGVTSVFLAGLDWPDVFSALDASFDLIPKIIFDQVTRTPG